MSVFAELKRRNVFKVALLYIVAGWLTLQVADVLFGQLGVPDWTFRFLFGMLVICFPLVLLFSWIFELTPEGIRRESDVADGASITLHTGQRINKAIVVLLTLSIVTVVVDRFIPEDDARPATVSHAEAIAAGTDEETELPEQIIEKSIAVLPFVNMSGDPDNEYFSDGLTEELLNALTRLGELKVAGRTSSFAFKGKEADLRDIASQLDVANLLEGSVRKDGNRVRITAQLVKASDGFHLWSDTYDRELDDIFEIQEEIAEMVAGALRATLLDLEEDTLVPQHTDDAEAYEAYLRGTFMLRRAPDDEDTRRRAEAEFLHALNLDQGFTLARWGLFKVLDARFRNGAVDFQQGVEELEELAGVLMDENPNLAESLLAKGRAASARYRFSDALDAYQAAVDTHPGNLDALNWMGHMFMVSGQPERAVERYIEVLGKDPIAAPVLAALTRAYFVIGQCDEARRIQQRAVAAMPGAARVNAWLAYCLLMNGGDRAEAIDLLSSEPVDHLRLTGLAVAHHLDGDSGRARAALGELEESIGEGASYQFGQIHAQWGEPATAIEWLQKAYDSRDPGIHGLLSDPLLKPLKLDPEFLRLQSQWKTRSGL
ncbi:MAG: tetratricopeptide repeat protein [Xanthomonadales bacterium]|nr:tetratricopeptide repeat protein [Xanthomonadales bacterium]NIX13508.1 tetratricopeptide repeat protein [Xanthomonadales bacterium]